MVSRMAVLLLFGLGDAATAGSTDAQSDAPQRPHIVMVLGDDVGSADVGYNGQLAADFAVKTPTLDKLSAAGVKLSAHYVRNWCAPTRAMIMTSRYELHFAQTGGGGTGHTNGVPVNFTLLPEALRRANYTSYGFGKWHLGESSPAQTPKARGFDYWLGYFGGQEDYYLHNVYADWPDANASNVPLPPHMDKQCTPAGNCKCWIIDLWQSDPQTEGPAPTNLTGEYSMMFYTRAAVETIHRQAELTQTVPNSRMFLYFASQLIHDPHQVPQRFVDLYAPTAGASGCPYNEIVKMEQDAPAGCDCCGRRTVMAMMSALDEAVLNITTALERSGLMANTLFVFASDNGGVVADHGSNVPLRGGKFSNWEGGVRSPAFIGGPLVPPTARGKWYNGIFSAADWGVTFLTLAGVSDLNGTMGAKPGHGTVPPLDGINMWGAIQAVGASEAEQAVASRTSRSDTWIDTGTLRVGDFKLITVNCGGRGLTGTGGGWIVPATNASKAYPNQGTKSSADPQDDFLLHGCNKTAPCLYHVGGGNTPYANDATERVNLAAEQPQRVAAMLARLAQYEETAWSGEAVVADTGRACDKAIANGGVLGPWQLAPARTQPGGGMPLG